MISNRRDRWSGFTSWSMTFIKVCLAGLVYQGTAHASDNNPAAAASLSRTIVIKPDAAESVALGAVKANLTYRILVSLDRGRFSARRPPQGRTGRRGNRPSHQGDPRGRS